MAASTAFSVDRSKLETYQARLRHDLEGHPVSWPLRQFGKALVFGMVLFGSIRLFLGDEAALSDRHTSSRLLEIVIAAVLFSGAMTGFMIWFTRRQLGHGMQDLAERIEREHARLTGPNWVGTVVRMGLRLTLGVGVPVGLLFALTPLSTGAGSRLLVFLSFLGMTALWAMPGAFVIRWSTLRANRQWQRDA